MATGKRISVARERNALPERRSPYWQALKRGFQIGCRKLNGGEYWLARAYVGNDKYEQRPLAGVQNWEEAVRASKGFFDHVERGGTVSRDTVSEVFDEYCKTTKASPTHGTVKASLGDLANVNINDPKLGAHLTQWMKSDALTKQANGKERSSATIKRMVAPLKAALNANIKNIVSTDWQRNLACEKVETTSRELYLTIDQRRQLIEHAAPDAKPFIKLLCSVPLRPGDWHDRTVLHFNRRTKTLRVESKNHERDVPLSTATYALLEAAAKDKTPLAPLFTRSSGAAWDKQSWNEAIKAAASRAKLPAETCAYTLRHSTITDLVTTGLDLVQVAKLAGTSLKMIDLHYGKLRADQQLSALDKIAV